MVTYAGAKSQWYEQAKACEDWLIKNQDPAAFDKLLSDAEGHTTALTTTAETQNATDAATLLFTPTP